MPQSVSFIFSGACAAVFLGFVPVSTGAPVISEFMADNKTTLMDEDGEFVDWIEIHNPDAVPVQLSGWSLTDSETNLLKWEFPAMTLEAGEFRVVYASGKNRRDPAGNLHSNFALSAGGEYLALVSPVGTAVSHFAPAYPQQEEDVSFGTLFSSSNLVTSGQSARYFVPSGQVPAASAWTAPEFNDSGWNTGFSGFGFGLLVPGMLVKEVQTNIAMPNLASLDAALAGAPNPPSLVADTRIRQVINLLGEGADGRFGNNETFALPGETHGLRATGFVTLPTAGAWTFGVNSDDGSRLRIDLNNDGDFLDAGENVIVDDSGHGPQDFFGSRTFAAAGAYRFEFVFFENGGGDEVELFAQSGTHASWNTGFRLLGDTDGGGLAVATAPDGSTGGGSVIATNLQSAMLGLRTSAYVRSSFNIANPAALDSISTLNLGISYNDGFTAWLNGVKIADRSAPADPAWNAVATATRGSTESMVPENINVTAFRGALRTGLNTLAVQGLNAGLADESFLILPTLTGGNLQTGDPLYFKLPTPGKLNNTPGSLGFVADTTFSHKRGHYTEPFTLTVTTTTPGASLRYTLDGSKPSTTTGILVSPPDGATPPMLSLPVSTTQVVRVMAFKTNYDPTNVDTNTYLFLDGVLQQPSTPPGPGWPDVPGSTAGKYVRNSQEYDYGMDPDIVNSTNPDIGGADQVKAALMAIPSVCVTVPVDSLTAASTGIYSNAGGDGFQWEREASIEMLNDPATLDRGFQENCGLRVRGGFSRSGDNPKHAFRIFFRSDYGAGKLDYPIFSGDPGAATEFDKFDIQTSQNYSWAFGGDSSNTFLRELWSRDTQLAMNQPTTRGKFVHLYLNGLYWGLYQIQERAEADFAASYHGGEDDDYDVVKVDTNSGYSMVPTAGDMNAWTDQWNKSRAAYFINTNRSPTAPYGPATWTQEEKNAAYFRLMGLAADGVTPTADPVLLDADNLIDYMLIIFYSGNTDAPLSAFLGNNSPNNYYAIRDRRGGRGFFHIQHDGEHSLNAGSAASNRVGPFNDPVNGTWNSLPKANAQFTHQDLAPNMEYRIRFADRTHRHMINPNGVLTTAQNQARMSERAAVVESAIIAESARWGDSKRGTGAPLTAQHWKNAVNSTLGWFNPRGGQLLTQLKGAGLYPTVDAPVMVPAGGTISANTAFNMTAGSTTIYYTVNGPDPRQIGGALSPAALVYTGGVTDTLTYVADGPSGTRWRYLDNGSDQGTAWREPGFDDSAWEGPQAGHLGYGDGDENLPSVDFGPSSSEKYITTYFRTTFTAPDITGLTGLTLDVKRDDGIVVYLNGTEIVRDVMPAGAIDYLTPATGAASDDGSEFNTFVNIPLNLLRAGTNSLAAEVHQSSGNSSDLSFDCRLTATRASGGTQLTLPAGVTTVRARVLNNSGTWSALNEQEFLVDTSRAAAGNLVVSEIMYHPADPSAEEIAAGYTSDQDFQWIEIMNSSTEGVDLRGAYFSEGIEFTFPDHSSASTLLPAGGRIILCENLAAFRQRYGSGFDNLIAGQFTGALANSGERLVLMSADHSVILDFTYDDAPPWPVEADGGGRSLVLLDSALPADFSLATSWKASGAAGGTPTTGEVIVVYNYASWKAGNEISSDTEDSDGDGRNAFAEYFHGTNPGMADQEVPLAIVITPMAGGQVPAPGDYPTFVFDRNGQAADTEWQLEQSSDAGQTAWTPAPVTLVSETTLESTGQIRMIYRLNTPAHQLSGSGFYRLRASLR